MSKLLPLHISGDAFSFFICFSPRIYDLQFMDKIYEEVAHDSEVLCLTYSKEVDGRPTNYISLMQRIGLP